MLGAAFKVEGRLNVLTGLTACERQGGARSFQLIKGPERLGTRLGRPIVVGVDHIAGEGLFLQFPLGIHIIGHLRSGPVVLHNGQHAAGRIVAATKWGGSVGAEADFTAVLAVGCEKEDSIGNAEPRGGHLAKIVVVDHRPELCLRARFEGNHHRGLRAVLVHAEHPDREQAGLLGPVLFSDVRQAVGGPIGHGPERCRAEIERLADRIRPESNSTSRSMRK